MKKLIFVLAGAVVLFSTSFKPDSACESSFFPQKVGTKWELTSYDKKDKVVSKSKSELMSISDIAGGQEAKISIETFDSKDKSTNKGEVTMKCQDDNFYMDMGNMFPSSQMAGMEEMDVDVEMTNQYMEFPSNPTAGQTLPDAESTMTMKVNGMQIMNTTIKITNRKIEGYEDITTPAGTFNCVKYTSDQEIISKVFKSKGRSVMYMAKNTGVVKMESFDDKDEMQSKMLLTAFSN